MIKITWSNRQEKEEDRDRNQEVARHRDLDPLVVEERNLNEYQYLIYIPYFTLIDFLFYQQEK